MLLTDELLTALDDELLLIAELLTELIIELLDAIELLVDTELLTELLVDTELLTALETALLLTDELLTTLEATLLLDDELLIEAAEELLLDTGSPLPPQAASVDANNTEPAKRPRVTGCRKALGINIFTPHNILFIVCLIGTLPITADTGGEGPCGGLTTYQHSQAANPNTVPREKHAVAHTTRRWAIKEKEAGKNGKITTQEDRQTRQWFYL